MTNVITNKLIQPIPRYLIIYLPFTRTCSPLPIVGGRKDVMTLQN